MSNELNGEWFVCIKNFSELRAHQEVFIGDKPDARTATILVKKVISHNWPSQWHTRFKAGYIEFTDRRKFDLANQTMHRRQVFLFRATPEIESFWKRQTLESAVVKTIDKIPSLGEKDNAVDLVAEKAHSSASHRWVRRHHLRANLHAIAIYDLEGLLALLCRVGGNEPQASPLAAP